MAGPKKEVSRPLEPGPEEETVNPWVLRKIWRLRTSGPDMPSFRVRVKRGREEVEVVGAGVEVQEVLLARLYLVTAPWVMGP